MTPSGIEPATCRLVVRCLNQLREELGGRFDWSVHEGSVADGLTLRQVWSEYFGFHVYKFLSADVPSTLRAADQKDGENQLDRSREK